MTPWTVAYETPLFMGLSRQEYCRGLPFSSPRDRPNPEIEPRLPKLQVDYLQTEPPGKIQRKKVKRLGEYPFKRKKKRNLFIYFWLCWVFVASWLFFSFGEWDYSRYGPWASHCSDFSCGARAHGP